MLIEQHAGLVAEQRKPDKQGQAEPDSDNGSQSALRPRRPLDEAYLAIGSHEEFAIDKQRRQPAAQGRTPRSEFHKTPTP